MYDVIVVGGGISGAMAAIASARAEAKTLLVEQYGFLGGMLTASGVGPMMTFHAGEKKVVQGITDELITRLTDKGYSTGHIFDTTGYTYTVTPFDAEGLKMELENMLLEAGGEILYHTMLAGVTVEDGCIKSIKVCNKAGLTDLYGKVFVDATGDADLAAWAGVRCTKGREIDGASQPMTMKIRMNNVNIDEIKKFIKENPDEFPRLNGDTDIVDKAPRLSIGGFVKTLEKARQNGEITFKREDVLFFETNNPGEVIVNTSRVLGCDSTEPWSLSKAEIEGRKQAEQLVVFLRKRVAGFKDAQVLYTGPFIGVRSSRQIVGLYTLTKEDILNCTKFEDVIAHSGYPIDIHPPEGEKPKSENNEHLEENMKHWGEVRNLPYRCLVNKEIYNLITVGRCVSVTFDALGAFRTTPFAGAIGHAGGVAAAITAQTGGKAAEIDIGHLHAMLRKQGGYLEI